MKSLRDYINLVSETSLISEKVTLNPDGTAPQTQTVTTPQGATFTANAPANSVQTGTGGVLKTGSGAAVTSGTPAPAPDAAAAAKAKLSPEQLKWLGGADPTDPIIMARLKKAVPDKPAAAAAPAAGAAAGAAAPTMTAADQEDADMGAAMTQNAAQAAALASGAQDDVTGLDAAIAAQAAAPAQAAQPAAPAGGKVPPQPTLNGKPSTGPKGQEWLKKYGATHNPDGSPKAGGTPAPAAPAQKPGLDASGRANAAADPRVAGAKPAQAAQPAPQAGAGRGFVNPPAAGAPAPAAPAAPATGKTYKVNGKPATKAEYDAQMAGMKNMGGAQGLANTLAQDMEESRARSARNDHKFIDELNAMRSIAGLPTKNKW